MLDNEKFDKVINLVKEWVPKKDYNHESGFQNDLKEYLDKELNEKESNGLILSPNGNRDDVIRRERGKSNADIVVNDEIGIELKRNLANSGMKRLRGQIEDYLDNYDKVIVCTCGLKDKGGWRELKNIYHKKFGGVGISKKEVIFIWKKIKDYGKDKKKNRKGLFGGIKGNNPLGNL